MSPEGSLHDSPQGERTRSGPAGARVRAEAARLNARVVAEGASLEAALAMAPGLPAADGALARALASGTLRWHHRLEWQIGRLVIRPLARKDVLLASLLRVGLFQLQGMRIPDHAAVSATVDAAPLLGIGRARGLINAVLRRFLRERSALEQAMASNPEALYGHPAWLLERLQRDWPRQWQSIVEANNQPPPMWIRVNVRRLSRAAYRDRLAAAGIEAEAPEGLQAALLLGRPVPVAELPGYGEGLVSVQDAAAQLAVSKLALGSGQRVLDACAAPGGKTAHLLESNPDLGEVVALDRDAARLDTLRQNLGRLGLEATVVEADATRAHEWWDGRFFDRILIDAPCSAVGVIRRHPDIKVLRRARDLGALTALQARLLDTLWPLLAPGGRMVYATCSVLKDENERQIGAFLQRAPGAKPGGEPSEGHQILPGEARMDGFYYACVDSRDL